MNKQNLIDAGWIAFIIIVVIVLIGGIVVTATARERYGTPVDVPYTCAVSGIRTPTTDYRVQFPRMVAPSPPHVCVKGNSSCNTLERDYPAWKVDKYGDQRMRTHVDAENPGFSGERHDAEHTYSDKEHGNLNPGEYKLYGWRHSQYTGDPFKIHRWYNNPDTMQGVYPANSIFKFDEECLFADTSLPTAVALSTGYNDNIDNEGADGNFQYPDTVGNHISNYYQTYDELA